jgi:hypothetical protein
MKKRRRAGRTILLFAICLGLSAGSATASPGHVKGEMQVSVTVIARALVDLRLAPERVEVRPADRARGWVELPGLELVARTNSRGGFILQMQLDSGPFQAAEIIWDSGRITTGAAPLPFESRNIALPVTLRLLLESGAAIGSYPWPLVIGAEPR